MSLKADVEKAVEELERHLLIAEAQVDILYWTMKLMGTGMPLGMIRGLLQKKVEEITGEFTEPPEDTGLARTGDRT